jgi:putative colanic acid biosynthesis UDP-glucose lipid carrier transferase
MYKKKGRYSGLIRPLLVLLDLTIIFLVILFYPVFSENVWFTANLYPNFPKDTVFIVYNLALWLLLAYFTKFYEVYRFTKAYHIVSVLVKQIIFFTFLILSYFGFLKVAMSRKKTVLYVILLFVLIGLFKYLIYYALKRYRYRFGGNTRKVIVIGSSEAATQLINFFKRRLDLGYQIIGVFNGNKDLNTTGNIEKSYQYIHDNKIDEIYCSLEDLEEWQINKYIELADSQQLTLKFIPKKNRLTADKVSTDYYGEQAIFSLKEPALNASFNQLIKRSFDIVFSLLVIIFVLSWLIPLMYVLIKIESKGPLFYKHIRYGINYNEFNCYKFRSLRTDSHDVLDQVKKVDNRVTKIGRFIRKTSIDELPQFINVLKGDMSVVGPRPHMIPYSNLYAKYIDKYQYMFRHSVKPGITGMAQVKGLRGETETDQDIINRIKYDVFYIENWNFFLDISIIFQTLAKAFRGDNKAY